MHLHHREDCVFLWRVRHIYYYELSKTSKQCINLYNLFYKIRSFSLSSVNVMSCIFVISRSETKQRVTYVSAKYGTQEDIQSSPLPSQLSWGYVIKNTINDPNSFIYDYTHFLLRPSTWDVLILSICPVSYTKHHEASGQTSH